jgi:glycosyltransferase involved in cell wall biosynthesis
MRVMYLSASGQMGGAESVLLDMLAGIHHAEPSWVLHLLAPADGPLVARAAALGVDTTVLPFPDVLAEAGEVGARGALLGKLRLIGRLVVAASAIARYTRRLRSTVGAFHPDVLHANGIKMHVLGAWVCPDRAGLIWHVHDYLQKRDMSARLLRFEARHCTTVIANSESVAEDARDALGRSVPVVAIHNGVDLDRFCPSGESLDLDALAGTNPPGPGAVRVGLVATFARWKGHTTFLEAVARLPRDLPVRAYVIGGPIYETAGSQHSLDELRALATNLGIIDRVGFTGFVERADSAIRALDIVVHASTAPEPFGLSIVEAMACGRAVIVSDAGGAREIVTPGVDALIHGPGDSAELAARIVDLVRNPDLRHRLGEAGRSTAVRRFDRARVARELLPLYQSLGHGDRPRLLRKQ